LSAKITDWTRRIGLAFAVLRGFFCQGGRPVSKHNRERRKLKNADMIITDRRSYATVKKDFDTLDTWSEIAAEIRPTLQQDYSELRQFTLGEFMVARPFKAEIVGPKGEYNGRVAQHRPELAQDRAWSLRGDNLRFCHVRRSRGLAGA
jgi:hypothetical protein